MCQLGSHNHIGHKLNITLRTYNVTVTHCRQILGSTCGHLSTWNNKTIVLFEKLVQEVNNSEIYGDTKFKFLERDADGTVSEVTYVGA